MKRWYAILMIVGLLFSLCACTQEEGSAQSPPPVQSAQQQQEQQTADTETTQQEQQIAGSEATQQQPEAAQGTPVVYMTQEITPEGLMAVYQALQWEPQGRVAVKLSTGEPPASNYLRPELIAGLVQSLDGTIVECNTPMAVPAPRRRCTIRWRRTTALPRLPISRFWMRKAR